MNQLKKMRLAAGITQTELGFLMDVSKQSVSNYENGLGQPPVFKVQKAIHALKGKGFDFTLDDVFPYTNEMKQAS